jgi:membrane-associated protein
MISANSTLNILYLFIILFSAAVIGDNVNYFIGRYFSRRIKNGQGVTFIKKEYVEKTEKFYEKYGTKAVVLARFAPIIRTITPFFAGFGSLNYADFLFYDVIGGFAWVSLFLFGGYYFGNVQIVKDNFSLAIMAVIIISLIPGIVEIVRERYKKEL